MALLYRFSWINCLKSVSEMNAPKDLGPTPTPSHQFCLNQFGGHSAHTDIDFNNAHGGNILITHSERALASMASHTLLPIVRTEAGRTHLSLPFRKIKMDGWQCSAYLEVKKVHR